MQMGVSAGANIYNKTNHLSRRASASGDNSPNPLLLLALHRGCPGQDAVDDLLLLVGELRPWGAARHVHRPPNLEEARACRVCLPKS